MMKLLFLAIILNIIMNNEKLIKNYRAKWTSFVKSKYFPTLLQNIQIIGYDEFKKNVFHDERKTEQIINSLLDGDAIILKGAINKIDVLNLKNRVKNWGKDTPEENYEEYTPVPNFHTKFSQKRKIEDLFEMHHIEVSKRELAKTSHKVAHLML